MGDRWIWGDRKSIKLEKSRQKNKSKKQAGKNQSEQTVKQPEDAARPNQTNFISPLTLILPSLVG
ncbi:MAG: hypothetical protein MUF49_18905 [Oculatellaceae cyanobacterium Prado106]|jgi:hypothetical protein|nr:hypothetical protein [Oculatellaceae cyanobacterium Prado106]